jgi:hypothetical protein
MDEYPDQVVRANLRFDIFGIWKVFGLMITVGPISYTQLVSLADIMKNKKRSTIKMDPFA